MRAKFQCPACGQELTIVTVMTAVTPFYFRCRHCKSSLKAKKVSWAIFLCTTLSAFITLGYLFKYVQVHGALDGSAFLVPALLIIGLEIVYGIIICNKADIIVRKDRRK